MQGVTIDADLRAGKEAPAPELEPGSHVVDTTTPAITVGVALGREQEQEE